MRKSKTIELDNRQVIVQELRVRDIRDLWAKAEQPDATLAGFAKSLETLLPKVCPDLTMDQLLDLYPGDLKLLWETVLEVNADFFAGAETLGLKDLLNGLKAAFLLDLTGLSAASFNPATAPEPGTTAGPSS
ncbi:MAG: hypothetical protein AB1641_19685 [Thermodesulfobacteriota bacterium]